MNADEILEALRSDYSSLVNAAERRLALKMRRTLWGVVVCCASMLAASGATWAVLRTSTVVPRASPSDQIIEGIHRLPVDSPVLVCMASSMIACEATLDVDGLLVAIACVGRASRGGFGEEFLRRQLLHGSPKVRREAVVWYPTANPAWESDPVGGPIYQQARSSLIGN